MARNGFEPEVHRRSAAEVDVVLRACPFEAAALADRATVCALHLGIADGLAEPTETVTELVAYDPRQAGCKLRLRLATDDEDIGGTLTLRGKVGVR
jgi:predicted ArsR family transcriptional regulator